MPRKKKKEIVAVEQIESCIYEIRNHRVMLDSDLARVYGVKTKQLIRAFKRNEDRFPQDFAFLLSNQELIILRYQFGTSSSWGGRRTFPYVFTEHGAIMAATMLNSPVAIEMSIHVVRAFVKARRFIEQHKDLAHELKELKRTLSVKFSEYDKQFRIVFQAIDQLIAPLEERKGRRIGFKND